ncbi:hypothetical protein D9M68_289150 [compost metagenome]
MAPHHAVFELDIEQPSLEVSMGIGPDVLQVVGVLERDLAFRAGRALTELKGSRTWSGEPLRTKPHSCYRNHSARAAGWISELVELIVKT